MPQVAGNVRSLSLGTRGRPGFLAYLSFQEDAMNDIDRYLKSEYPDAKYHRCGIQTSSPGFGPRLVGWVAHLLASWRRTHPVPLAVGEQHLGPASVKVWSVGAEGPNLHCVSGSLWLTKTGDTRDYILVAGQNRRLEAGQWVIQALTPAEFCVYSPTTEEVPHGQASLLSAF